MENEIQVSTSEALTRIVHKLRNPPSPEGRAACDIEEVTLVKEYLAEHQPPPQTGGRIESGWHLGLSPIALDASQIPAANAAARAFADAIWHLCRHGILRPGPAQMIHRNSTRTTGYSLTVEGQEWIATANAVTLRRILSVG